MIQVKSKIKFRFFAGAYRVPPTNECSYPYLLLIYDYSYLPFRPGPAPVNTHHPAGIIFYQFRVSVIFLVIRGPKVFDTIIIPCLVFVIY